MTTIMLVDDEAGVDVDRSPEDFAGYMWYYVRALLDEGYEVFQVTSVDRALDELSNDVSRFGLVVVDIMMPPGKAFGNEDTKYGLRTGTLLVGRLGEDYPELPVVVLTNVDNTEDLNALRNKRNVREVSAKPFCTPVEFVEVVRRVLQV